MTEDGTCDDSHCDMFNPEINGWCMYCAEGYFLEWDTGRCVHECDPYRYQTDHFAHGCVQICEEGTHVPDPEHPGNCVSCEAGHGGIDYCEICESEAMGRHRTCVECGYGLIPSLDGS